MLGGHVILYLTFLLLHNPYLCLHVLMYLEEGLAPCLGGHNFVQPATYLTSLPYGERSWGSEIEAGFHVRRNHLVQPVSCQLLYPILVLAGRDVVGARLASILWGRYTVHPATCMMLYLILVLTGREVVGVRLASMLGGRYVVHPATCLMRYLDDIPRGILLRRAYYVLSLYVTSFNVKVHLSLGRPVVLNGSVNDILQL